MMVLLGEVVLWWYNNLMNSVIFDEVTLERRVRDEFGLPTEVDKIILHRVDVGHTAHATVFLTKKKQLLLYVEAKSPMLLADIKKIVSRMGLKAEMYMPPKGQPNYFDEIGREKFRQVFPGRSMVSDKDIMFYRTLAPYNPALVMISEVKQGEIYQFDADSRGGWRVATKFAYRRIRTS